MQIANGAQFWVQGSDGKSFPEHKLEVKKEGLKMTYIAYLEITLGSPFSICCEAPPMDFDTDIKFYADNSFIAGKCTKTGKARKEIISGKPIGASTSRSLKFSNLETTDDDDNCNRDDNYLLKLGEIECRFTYGSFGESKDRKFEDVSETAKVHERVVRKSKKSTLIGSQVGYGEAVKAKNHTKLTRFDVNHTLPTYFVIFKYRTRQALILSKILEEEPVVEGKGQDEDVKPFASSSSSKRKVDSDGDGKKKAIVLDDDDEEDVKPFKKRAGSSKETAIDLTDF